MEVAEPKRSSEIAFFKEPFILASGNGYLINYKLVDTMLQIRCKPIFFEFFNS